MSTLTILRGAGCTPHSVAFMSSRIMEAASAVTPGAGQWARAKPSRPTACPPWGAGSGFADTHLRTNWSQAPAPQAHGKLAASGGAPLRKEQVVEWSREPGVAGAAEGGAGRSRSGEAGCGV